MRKVPDPDPIVGFELSRGWKRSSAVDVVSALCRAARGGSCSGVGAYFGVARTGVATVATAGITLCGVEHKRDGVIGREVAGIALIMFAEKSCASATRIL